MSSNDKDENCFVYYKYASNARQCKLGILILATSTMIFVRRLIKLSLHFYFNVPLVDEIKTSQPPAAPPTLSPSLMNCQGFESFSGKHMEYEEPNSLQQIGVTKYLQTLIVLFRLLSCRATILAWWWAAGTEAKRSVSATETPQRILWEQGKRR